MKRSWYGRGTSRSRRLLVAGMFGIAALLIAAAAIAGGSGRGRTSAPVGTGLGKAHHGKPIAPRVIKPRRSPPGRGRGQLVGDNEPEYNEVPPWLRGGIAKTKLPALATDLPRKARKLSSLASASGSF